ncbi:MAG: NUMOD4 domain-containing protein, partial [Mycobacterium sp.]
MTYEVELATGQTVEIAADEMRVESQLALFNPRCASCTEPCIAPLCWACLPTVTAMSAWDIEVWLPVPGHEGYEVSNLGRVRSLDRVVVHKDGRRQPWKGRVLQPVFDSKGYPQVGLPGRTSARIHRLVSHAFFGPAPTRQGCLHWDDNPTDSRLCQLRYGTQSDNMRDCTRNGRHHLANKTHCPAGHEYNGTHRDRHGQVHRQCRICRRDHDRAYARRKAVIAKKLREFDDRHRWHRAVAAPGGED